MAIKMVNTLRQDLGLYPLKSETLIQSTAQAKADDMVINNYFAHTSPIFGTTMSFYNRHGIEYYNENIFSGWRNVDGPFHAWFFSDGHYRALLQDGVSSMGIAHGLHDSGKWCFISGMGSKAANPTYNTRGNIIIRFIDAP